MRDPARHDVVRHAILIAFSAAILLPLLWMLRVSLTDKLTAYKIPPEIGTSASMNYVEVFTAYGFTSWFANSLIVALAATAISLPAGDRDGLCRRPLRTGGSPLLRLGVLASQMLPPIILVLPLFGLFLPRGLMQSPLALIIAHSRSPCRSWPG